MSYYQARRRGCNLVFQRGTVAARDVHIDIIQLLPGSACIQLKTLFLLQLSCNGPQQPDRPAPRRR